MQKKIQAIGKSKVFTVDELCQILNINIPKKYLKYKEKLIVETKIFKKLENYKSLIEKMIIKDDFDDSYYLKLKKSKRGSEKFVQHYNDSVLMNQNDEELFEKFVKYLYLFFPRFNASEYFYYKLYNKSLKEAKTFIGIDFNNRIIGTCNKGARKILKHCSDKAIFNQMAKKYVNRDYLDMRTSTFEQFVEFSSKHNQFFVKPFGSNQGKGTEILTVSDNAIELFQYCKNNQTMIEELIIQHPDISIINQSTVNTIRVLTLLPVDDNPIVTGALIRIGREGKIIDNASAGGMVAAIDLDSGKIFTNAVDIYDNEFTHHPDSGAEFKGLQIPHWEEIITAVKETAVLFSKIRHIGWDVTVTSEGNIEFVEGNDQPAFWLIQFADQVGKKHLYRKPIQELRQQKKDQSVSKSENQ